MPLPDLSHAALLSMDLQSAIVSIYTKGQEDFLPRIAGVQNWARARGMPVIHVRMGFRPGMPEVSLRNPLVAAIKTNPQWRQLFEGEAGAIHAAVAPEGD